MKECEYDLGDARCSIVISVILVANVLVTVILYLILYSDRGALDRISIGWL